MAMKNLMKKYACFLFLGSVLSINALAFTVNDLGNTVVSGSVEISLLSIGGDFDEAALRTVRQMLGHAFANGTIDTICVENPLLIEGGFIAHANIGFNVTEKELKAFILQLNAIHPREGTSYNVQVNRQTSCSCSCSTM